VDHVQSLLLPVRGPALLILLPLFQDSAAGKLWFTACRSHPHGTLRLGQEAEFTDLALGLHWAVGRLTITQASPRIAGGVMALRGEVALQEPTPSQVLHWRLAGIRVEQVLGAALQPVTIAEATGRLTNQGAGLVLETALQIPVFALAPGTLGQRQPRLTHVALTCTLKLLPSLTRLAMEACQLHATEAQLSWRGGAVDFGPKPQLTLQVDGVFVLVS
jgi:hypothetical protein